jgi:hypothetical protein
MLPHNGAETNLYFARDICVFFPSKTSNTGKESYTDTVNEVSVRVTGR